MLALRRLLLLLAAGLAAALAHWGHVAVDRVRHEFDIDMALLFLPSGKALKVASLGFHEMAADLLWIKAVLLFGERWGKDPTPEWGPWMAGMIDAVVELDPQWRTPYFYGGMFLKVMGDVEHSDQVFLRGAQAFPDDPFFPFALGANAWFLRHDARTASRWLSIAAQKPGAPAWYAGAAAAFLAEGEHLETAIRFAEEELRQARSPEVREVLKEKLKSLYHDQRAEQLEELRRQYRERFGRDIVRVEDLLVLGEPLPEDPYGTGWIVAPDGAIRSRTREAAERRKAQSEERRWLRRETWARAGQ